MFEKLPEGRKAKGRLYPQSLMLCLMTLAKLCGYHAYAEMARFVRNHPYLLPLLGFSRPDLPCDDTFCYVMRHLDVEQYEGALTHWAQQELVALSAQEGEADDSSLEAYAVDGKTLRGSGDKYKGHKAAHLLSLVHQRYRTTIAQQQVPGKRTKPLCTGSA